MNKLWLVLTLVVFWVSTSFGGLGDTENQILARWWGYIPVKALAVDSRPEFQTHALVYAEGGSVFVYWISNNISMMEIVYTSPKSIESMESILTSWKGRYSEGRSWRNWPDKELIDQTKPAYGLSRLACIREDGSVILVGDHWKDHKIDRVSAIAFIFAQYARDYQLSDKSDELFRAASN